MRERLLDLVEQDRRAGFAPDASVKLGVVVSINLVCGAASRRARIGPDRGPKQPKFFSSPVSP